MAWPATGKFSTHSYLGLLHLDTNAFPQTRTGFFFLAQLWRWQKSLRTPAELARVRLYHVCVCPLGLAEPSSGCRLSQALADPPYGFDRLRDVCVGWLGRPEPSSGSRLSQALADPPFGINTNYGMSALVGWILLSQALAFA